MPDETNKLENKSGDAKYFTLVPRIVQLLKRDPYDLALWVTIKEICGGDDSGRECYLSTEQLAILSGMSEGKVIDCRRYLIAQGLLEGNIHKDPGYPQPVWHLKVPDVWGRNTIMAQQYLTIQQRIDFILNRKNLIRAEHSVPPEDTVSSVCTEPSPHEGLNDEEPSPHEGSIEGKPSPHEGLNDEEPSPGEQGGTPHEGRPSPGESKNNHKEKPTEKLPDAREIWQEMLTRVQEQFYGGRSTPFSTSSMNPRWEHSESGVVLHIDVLGDKHYAWYKENEANLQTCATEFGIRVKYTQISFSEERI